MDEWTVYIDDGNPPSGYPDNQEPRAQFESYEEARNHWTDEDGEIADSLHDYLELDDDGGESRRADIQMFEDSRESEEFRSPHGPRSIELPLGGNLVLERMDK